MSKSKIKVLKKEPREMKNQRKNEKKKDEKKDKENDSWFDHPEWSRHYTTST